MKLFDKIKNALFEEVDDDDDEVVEEKTIAKKIDVEKTTEEIPVRKEIVINSFDDDDEEDLVPAKELTRFKESSDIESKFETPKKGPIIFDDEDFFSDTREISFKEPKKEDKPIYGGYEAKEKPKEKEKFAPSPIISPVYGVLNKNYKKETFEPSKKSLDHLFVEERKKSISLDSIRNKAYGKNEEEVKEEDILLYEMSTDERPGIEKVTIGDAEEYFDDLGLEYDVDYKDVSKDKKTRTKKNEELIEEVEQSVEEDMDITQELITSKDIEETDEIDISFEDDLKDEDLIPDDDNEEEVEEKNLYDLINMMYEGKE